MLSRLHAVLSLCILATLVALSAAGAQPRLSLVMRQTLDHSKAILGAVITSDWSALDRESRALAQVTRDPAWTALTAPEYLRQSDAIPHRSTAADRSVGAQESRCRLQGGGVADDELCRLPSIRGAAPNREIAGHEGIELSGVLRGCEWNKPLAYVGFRGSSALASDARTAPVGSQRITRRAPSLDTSR
jgi:hypothetical protein